MQRFTLSVLVILGFAASAQAQRPHAVRSPSSRWVINGHSTMALGTSVTDAFNEVKTSSGLGAGVELGYRVTPRLLAYAGLEIAKQPVDAADLDGDFGLTHLEAGARLSFPIARSKMVPYVGAWIGRRSLSTTMDDLDTGTSSDLSLSGMAAGASGGVQVFVSPKLALDGGLSIGVGKMGNIKFDGQKQITQSLERTTTTRLRFGANWYP
jgi:outer membrane protein with beta-barrel domain